MFLSLFALCYGVGLCWWYQHKWRPLDILNKKERDLEELELWLKRSFISPNEYRTQKEREFDDAWIAARKLEGLYPHDMGPLGEVWLEWPDPGVEFIDYNYIRR